MGFAFKGKTNAINGRHRVGQRGPQLILAAFQRLLAQAWPGHLRELRNALDYAASFCAEGPIDVDDLPELQVTRLPAHVAAPDQDTRLHGDPDALRQALRAAQWNVSAVARQMGLARMTLYRRMKLAGIVPPNRMG